MSRKSGPPPRPRLDGDGTWSVKITPATIGWNIWLETDLLRWGAWWALTLAGARRKGERIRARVNRQRARREARQAEADRG